MSTHLSKIFDVGDRDLPVPTSGNWVIRGCMTKWFLKCFYVFWKSRKTWLFTFFSRCCTRFLEHWSSLTSSFSLRLICIFRNSYAHFKTAICTLLCAVFLLGYTGCKLTGGWRSWTPTNFSTPVHFTSSANPDMLSFASFFSLYKLFHQVQRSCIPCKFAQLA